MKIFLLTVFTGLLLRANAQAPQVQEAYDKGIYAIAKEEFEDAYKYLKYAHEKCESSDTLYDDVFWFYIVSVANLEHIHRMKESWDSSLAYSQEAMKAIEAGKEVFGESFGERGYWMIKNIIVAYFGLNQVDKAKPYIDRLYKAYKNHKLPDGIDQYFNFEFFRWNGNNVWGYQWYADLDDPAADSNFSKVVYYVYTTLSDGSDREQLFRIHLLKYEKAGQKDKIDYILTRMSETNNQQLNDTLPGYTYTKKIDYIKLRSDVREVLKNLEK